VRRVVCDGCGRAYEPHTFAPAPSPAGPLSRPPGRVWWLLSIPIAAAAVIGALLLIQELDGERAAETPVETGGGESSPARQEARLVRAPTYAALALAVPLPALAIASGTGGGGSLDVQASLAGCGVGGSAIVCRIDASFTSIDDAEYYTASVTAADGSVTDLGRVEAGGASVSVPYTGNGTYTVTITAWGYDEDGNARVVEEDESGAGEAAKRTQKGELEAVPAPEQIASTRAD
jgi:hypothetical protein